MFGREQRAIIILISFMIYGQSDKFISKLKTRFYKIPFRFFSMNETSFKSTNVC